MSTAKMVVALAASVLLMTGAACAANDDAAQKASSSAQSERDPEVVTYCNAAREADARIGAQLKNFDPETTTPSQLQQLFEVAVFESGAVEDSAPAALSDELSLLHDRWREQQEVFANAAFNFADAPPGIMDLVGEELEAFEKVAQFNTSRCSLDHLAGHAEHAEEGHEYDGSEGDHDHGEEGHGHDGTEEGHEH